MLGGGCFSQHYFSFRFEAVTLYVWCIMYHSIYVNTALSLYWSIYRNSRYWVVRPWSKNSLHRAFHNHFDLTMTKAIWPHANPIQFRRLKTTENMSMAWINFSQATSLISSWKGWKKNEGLLFIVWMFNLYVPTNKSINNISTIEFDRYRKHGRYNDNIYKWHI